MDGLLARFVQLRSGAFEDCAPFGIVGIKAASNDLGSLIASLQRCFPSWGDDVFPMTRLARASCGLADGGKGNGEVKDESPPLFPKDVHRLLLDRDFDKEEEEVQEVMAAIALASALSLPVSVTCMLEVREVDLVIDKEADNRSAVVLGFQPRPGRKTARARAVEKTYPAAWLAASTPSVHSVFAPWFQLARSRSWTHIFPAVSKVSKDTFAFDDSKPLQQKRAQSFIKVLHPKGTWHTMRHGTARALDLVHTVPEAKLAQEVPLSVKNTLQMRSNKALKGSNNEYTQALLRPLLAATRWLHLVEVHKVKGLLDEAEPEYVDAPFSTRCHACGMDLPVELGGALCNKAGCTYAQCDVCFPDRSLDLWCEEHRPDQDDS
jgi:hypothetical protein